MSEMIERLVAAVRNADNPLDGDPIGVMIHTYEFLDVEGHDAQMALVDDVCRSIVRAVLQAMREPGSTWDGLARRIMMWLDMDERHTPRTLLIHLSRSGVRPPQWLLDEPEMKNVDHVMSKGTRCVLIYRAMIDAALEDPRHG